MTIKNGVHPGDGIAFIERPRTIIKHDAYVSAHFAFATAVHPEKVVLGLGRDEFETAQAVVLEMDPETAVHIIGALTFALAQMDEHYMAIQTCRKIGGLK